MTSISKREERYLVVLLGPTGVGKSKTAITIAKHLGSPVINADSRQIFAELPIGTAAPTTEQLSQVRHYFVGSLHVTDYYSASRYEQDCLALLQRLYAGEEDGIKHRVVLLSGGSMMYIDAVCNGIDDIPTIDEKTRDGIKERLKRDGLTSLLDELRAVDPEYWKIVDHKNTRRVVHALEICQMTGKTYTSFRKHTVKKRPFRILKIGLNRPREEMYERINLRVLEMLDNGLEQEVLNVLPYRNLNALNTVGYKEMFNYVDGLLTRDEAVRQIQSNTRRYMRKQITWFKKDSSVVWFNPGNIEEIINYIDNNIL